MTTKLIMSLFNVIYFIILIYSWLVCYIFYKETWLSLKRKLFFHLLILTKYIKNKEYD